MVVGLLKVLPPDGICRGCVGQTSSDPLILWKNMVSIEYTRSIFTVIYISSTKTP